VYTPLRGPPTTMVGAPKAGRTKTPESASKLSGEKNQALGVAAHHPCREEAQARRYCIGTKRKSNRLERHTRNERNRKGHHIKPRPGPDGRSGTLARDGPDAGETEWKTDSSPNPTLKQQEKEKTARHSATPRKKKGRGTGIQVDGRLWLRKKDKQSTRSWLLQ